MPLGSDRVHLLPHREPDRAIAPLEHLPTVAGSVSQVFESSIATSELRLRWHWNPFRSDPRFQNTLAAPRSEDGLSLSSCSNFIREITPVNRPERRALSGDQLGDPFSPER